MLMLLIYERAWFWIGYITDFCETPRENLTYSAPNKKQKYVHYPFAFIKKYYKIFIIIENYVWYLF